MEILKNKLYLSLLILLLLGGAIAYAYWPKQAVSKDSLEKWISDGYSQQFCKVVYPKLSNCLTLSVNDCQSVAEEQIATCLAADAQDLPTKTDPESAKKIYASYAKCFMQNMHDIILDDYLVDSPDCQELMQ